MLRVVAAVIESGGKLLICQRRASGMFPLKWEFPGGKTRPGESPRAALARELREELAVEVHIGRELSRVVHHYAEMNSAVEVAFFRATLLRRSGSFAPPRNLAFERICWVHRVELARYDFLPADRPLIRRLIRGEFRLNKPFTH